VSQLKIGQNPTKTSIEFFIYILQKVCVINLEIAQIMVRKYCFLLFALMAFVSCKKDPEQVMQIILENQMAGKIRVQLFPKQQYISNGLYEKSETMGGYVSTEFELMLQGRDQIIYESKNIHLSATHLARQVFDSIMVLNELEEVVITYYPDSVQGQEENLFTADSAWSFEFREYKFHTNFKTKIKESRDFRFMLSSLPE
jgi:hypothetical protein